MTEQPLVPGLHEQLITRGAQAALDAKAELRAEIAKVDPADQPHVLARHIYELTRRALENHTDAEGRILLLNQLVTVIEEPGSTVAAPARQLRRLVATAGPGVVEIESVRPKTPGFSSYDDGLAAIRIEQAATAELDGVIDLVFDETRHDALPLTDSLADVPLRVHASYQREEILAALDYANLLRKPTSMMQGVAYSEPLNVDAFFVTLKKSEADYSPTTMYRDYPISPTLFHWESQNATSVSSPTGQRYLTGTSTVLLFCRIEHKGEYDTAPYTLLGPASYVSHVGERPIAITWRLRHAMPSTFFASATLAGQ